jgi:hypothetical protein
MLEFVLLLCYMKTMLEKAKIRVPTRGFSGAFTDVIPSAGRKPERAREERNLRAPDASQTVK